MSEKKYDIETEMALLRQEMKQTREAIKKYNGLREDLVEVKERVVVLETKRGAVNSTKEWILFAIIIAQLIFQLIPKFVN